MRRSTALLCLASIAFATSPRAEAESIEVHPRTRVETAEGNGRFHAIAKGKTWDAERTAVIVVDVWDSHHSRNAVLRVKEMAPRMNRFVKEARRRGATIVHAPSGCMDSYVDHPARRRVADIPRAKNMPEEIGRWCYVIPSEERGEYPLDQTRGGEDDDPLELARWQVGLLDAGLTPGHPWRRQIDVLEIDGERDFVSDRGEEVWSILEHRGLENVIVLGVHTNMCVLGRPFGLRRMAENGKNVVLVRDLTDTMYDPDAKPFVSHFTGTDRIVEHIEKYVCPTIASTDLLGGKPHRFSKDDRPHVVIVMAEREYETNRTLPEFARTMLGRDFRVTLVHANPEDRNDIPGLAAVADVDVLLLSVRRRVLPPEQLQFIRDHVRGGKPVVAIRTASHAFALRNAKPPEGLTDWPEFDRDVLGGNYSNHHGNGPDVEITLADGAAGHPLLSGVDVEQFVGKGSLYKTTPLAKSTTPLLIGAIPDQQPEPVAWINEPGTKNRVFYTSLGHPDDFEQDAFRKLLLNSLYWAAERDVPPALPEPPESTLVKTTPVTGQVTLDGEPLPGAVVVFEPEKGRPAAGWTDANGEYRLRTFVRGDGAVRGAHEVRITRTLATPDEPRQVVPERFNAKTTLRVDVGDEESTFDFELQSK